MNSSCIFISCACLYGAASSLFLQVIWSGAAVSCTSFSLTMLTFPIRFVCAYNVFSNFYYWFIIYFLLLLYSLSPSKLDFTLRQFPPTLLYLHTPTSFLLNSLIKFFIQWLIWNILLFVGSIFLLVAPRFGSTSSLYFGSLILSTPSLI